MLDATEMQPPSGVPGNRALPPMQRSTGAARVSLSLRGGATRLDGLHQSGCAKAMLPRTHGPCPEVVFLNTAGGVTGGDRLDYALDLAAGAQALGATQTAERAYRSAQGSGRITVDLTLGAGARLDWLPQETILFEGSDTRRETRVGMADDSTLLWAETLVMGRAAMGETLHGVALRDLRRVRRGGRLALVEPLALEPGLLTARAGLGGARAISTVAFLCPGAEDALGPVRALRQDGVQAAASAWDGKLVLRALAGDALPLKRLVAAVVTTLRGGAAMPRVWQV